MAIDDLTQAVLERGALETESEAERTVQAVLSVLAERLSRSEAEALADELPATWAETLRAGRFERAFERDELVVRVAEREGVPRGFALEHTEVVCATLAGALSEATMARLERALTPSLLTLFTRRALSATPPERAIGGHGHTLADGRPGSRRPLSEAVPSTAHSESVASTANPHADTKLSTARGLTQERESESLATGRPTSDRPLNRG